MNNKKAVQILIIVLIAAVAVLAIYFLGKTGEAPIETQPVVDTGKFAPKLNNTLETSVTVINPTEAAPQQ
jgi:hypothetical protein